MCLRFLWIIGVLLALTMGGFCRPAPDSAGIVPLPEGLAYGGIPYGSVSGQLSLYYGDYEPIVLTNKVSGNEIPSS